MIRRWLSHWLVPRSDFEQVHQALVTARGLLVRHHEYGRTPTPWGGFCSICHREDGTEPEFDQIHAALDVREHL